jgi:4-hydroxy-tetrahydrodipicolinate reductase
MIKLVISGSCGRMGSKIAALAAQDEDIRITGALEKEGNPNIGKRLEDVLRIKGLDVEVSSNSEETIKKGDVLIEFTSPEATLNHLEIAAKNKKAMVIGTTAIDEAGIKKIKDASIETAIVFSPNMSVGVNLLFKLTKDAASVLKNYNISMTEAHHVHKKDAPSGTAKKLAGIVKEAGGREVPIKSIREGEIVGDHELTFEGEFETLKLGHHAKSRDVFASGGLIAAKFVAGKKKGLFNMQDVLK